MELAHADLSRRLEGFPQQYATKVEAESAAAAVQRLEKDALPREIYDQNNKILEDAVIKVEREKVDETVFNTFVDNYRIELTRAQEDRRAVVEALSTATERVRAQVMEERADYVSQEYYDQRHSGLVNQINGVERWQYKMVGGLVFATFIAPLLTGVLVYMFTSGKI